MQKVFTNGSEHDNRDIMIEIKDGYIEFFFNDYYLKQSKWIEEETQRRLDEGGEELTDDEAGNHGFYWMSADDWRKSKTENLDRADNWHIHMNQKNWFTPSMEKFMDDNT